MFRLSIEYNLPDFSLMRRGAKNYYLKEFPTKEEVYKILIKDFELLDLTFEHTKSASLVIAEITKETIFIKGQRNSRIYIDIEEIQISEDLKEDFTKYITHQNILIRDCAKQLIKFKYRSE